MGFISWATGHDEKEADVYANYSKVDAVVTGITEIGNNEVASAKDAVHDAINSLNSVNGLSTYVGAVDVGAFDSVFEEITKSIAQIGELVESKANDIKTYSEAKWYEKLGSSFAMGSSKIGEGFLSVFEGIGDGVVSLVGWVAPKDSGVEKACANFVEKNWSHDAFNFYYKSEFAKKSTFTEDSAISGAFKIGGEALGYLAIGGFASGAGGAIASRTAGSVSKLGKAANAAGTFMSSTTKANTVIAGISGMGQGTESALQQGLSMDEAAWSGVKQGATQAAVAYGMGKLGERSAKKSAINEAKNARTEAYETVQKARKTVADAETKLKSAKSAGQFSKASHDLNAAEAQLKVAKNSYREAGQKIVDASKASYQGYNDAITKASQKAGAKYANSVADNGFIKTTIGTPLKAGTSLVTKGGKTAISGVKATGNAIRHPINTAKSTFASTKAAASSGASSIKSAASSAKTKIVDAATSAGKTVKSAAKTPIKSTINAAKTVVSTPAKVAGKVISNPATAGVTAATLNATGSTMNSAYGSAMKSANNKSTAQFKISGDNPVKAAKNVDYNLGGNTKTVNTNPSSGGSSSTPSTGGGSSSTSGGGYSSRSGGGSYTPTSATPTATASAAATGNSSEQFKAENSQNKKTKQVLVDKEVTRVPTKEPSTPTKTPNKPTNDVIDNVTPKPPTNVDNTPTNPTNTPSTPTNPSNNPSTTVTVTPSNTGGGTVQHTGGGYSGTSGYTPYTENSTIEDVSSPLESIVDETKTSIDDIVKGSKYTKIPTSSKPISTTSSGSGGSAVIPVVAGLSAAAAAGVGAKVYMDRKKNNDNGEDDEIYTEEWNGDDTISLDYDDSSDTQAYLDDDDDYGYQEAESTEKYDARNNEELADLQ